MLAAQGASPLRPLSLLRVGLRVLAPVGDLTGGSVSEAVCRVGDGDNWSPDKRNKEVDILAAASFQALNGVVWGLMVALISVGLSLIFGLTEVINVAHGEFYMLGAVLAWYMAAWTGNLWTAALVAPIAVGGLGLLLERFTLRRIERRPVVTILVTFGLALILQHVVLLVFGPAPRRLVPPPLGVVSLMGRDYPVYRILVAAAAVVTLTVVATFLRFTRLGLWVRAVQQDQEMALALGIPVGSVYMATFGIGAGLAGLAGVLVAPITAIEFQMGSDILPLAFMAVIVGGLRSLRGTVAASLSLGILEGLFSVGMSPVLARCLTLVTLGLFVLGRTGQLWPRLRMEGTQ